MAGITTPIPNTTDIAEAIGGKAFNRVIAYDVTGVAVKYYLDTQPISAVALPLPTGAATDAKLEAVRALLAGTLGVSAAALPLPAGAATDAKLEAVRLLLAGTLGVSAAALPLPAGAATSTKQDAVAPADDIWPITNSDSALAPIPRALLVLTAGNLIVKGSSGQATTIPVVAGQHIMLKARYVMAASSATVAGLG